MKAANQNMSFAAHIVRLTLKDHMSLEAFSIVEVNCYKFSDELGGWPCQSLSTSASVGLLLGNKELRIPCRTTTWTI